MAPGQVSKLTTVAAQSTDGTVTTSPVWAPIAQLALNPTFAQATSTGRLYVQLRFTNPSNTAWQIDDLYVDPSSSGKTLDAQLTGRPAPAGPPTSRPRRFSR